MLFSLVTKDASRLGAKPEKLDMVRARQNIQAAYSILFYYLNFIFNAFFFSMCIRSVGVRVLVWM